VTPAPRATAEPRNVTPPPASATPAYDDAFESRFQGVPAEDPTTFSPVDSYEDANGRSSGGRLLDEFLVEDPADEEPAGRRVSSSEGQDDEENASVWRPGRWIGN
jgi:hypothetical protein